MDVDVMSGNIPAQADLNWQMTGLFLLALVLLGFVMELLPVRTTQCRRPG